MLDSHRLKAFNESLALHLSTINSCCNSRHPNQTSSFPRASSTVFGLNHHLITREQHKASKTWRLIRITFYAPTGESAG